MSIINKIKQFFTRKTWTTIWIAKGKTTAVNLFFGGSYKTTVYAKVQVSNKGTWRTIITDGDDVQDMDSDVLFNKCPDAKLALEEWKLKQRTVYPSLGHI